MRNSKDHCSSIIAGSISRSIIKIWKKQQNLYFWWLTLVKIILFCLWCVVLDTSHNCVQRCVFEQILCQFHCRLTLWQITFWTGSKQPIDLIEIFKTFFFFLQPWHFLQLSLGARWGVRAENELLTRSTWSSLYFSKHSLRLAVFIMAKRFHFTRVCTIFMLPASDVYLLVIYGIRIRWCPFHDSSALVHL